MGWLRNSDPQLSLSILERTEELPVDAERQPVLFNQLLLLVVLRQQRRCQERQRLSRVPAKHKEYHRLQSVPVESHSRHQLVWLPVGRREGPPGHGASKPRSLISYLDVYSLPSDLQFQYMDRRRRNNEAAKRCRANRRAVFEYRSRRAQQLEIENGELRQEMFKLNQELEQLKSIIAANARLLPTT